MLTERRRQVVVWMVLSALVVSVLVVREVGIVLGDIRDASQHAANLSVLLGAATLPDPVAAVTALQTWAQWDGAPRALRIHVGASLVLLAASALLLPALLRWLGASRRFTTGVVASLVAVGLLRTSVTWALVPTWLERLAADPDAPVGTGWLVLLWVLANATWFAVAVAGVAAVALWATSRTDTTSGLDLARHRERTARAGGVQSPVIALRPVLAVCALFLVLVALPAGGPLEQLPDVLRRRLADPASLVVPTLALVLACAMVALAGLRSTDPAHARPSEGTSTMDWAEWAVAASPWVVAKVLGWTFDWRVTLAALAPLVVLGGLRGLEVFQRAVRRPPGSLAHRDPLVEDTSDDAVAVVEEITPERVDELDDRIGAEVRNPVPLVAALVAVLVLGGSVGLVRAVLPVWIVQGQWTGRAIAVMLLSVVVPALGWGLFVGVVEAFGEHGRFGWTFVPPPGLYLGVLAVVVVAATTLAVWPLGVLADQLGTLGSLALLVGAWAGVVGALVDLGRRRPPWAVTAVLGWRARTPFLTLAVAAWLVAGVLDGTGGYHDVRSVPVGTDGGSDGAPVHDDLGAAVGSWLSAADDVAADTCQAVPMVYVAAPGGGIRAAYWTASALDELARLDTCGPPVFAVSGVSGGAVGASAWLSAPEGGAVDAVRTMANEAALTAALTGLLTRDALQPFHGIVDAYDDRAALLERGWEDGAPGIARPWWSLRGTDDFTPVMLSNGSSVTTGCRTVATNVAGLPLATPDCLGPVRGGAMTGTIDLLAVRPSPRAMDSLDEDGALVEGRTTDVDAPAATVRASTAGLLSARFPGVSPSGAIRPCAVVGSATGCSAAGVASTWVVDGGYFENTGLLSLLEVMEAVEVELAEQCATTDAAAVCGRVEPWIVVANNAKGQVVPSSPPARPHELLVPFQTSMADQTSGAAALAQAAEAMVPGGTCPTADGDPCPARVVDLRPPATPSVTAPLGWVLSSVTMDEFDDDVAALFAVVDDPAPVRDCPGRDPALCALWGGASGAGQPADG